MPRRETRATLPYFEYVCLAHVKMSPLSFAVLNIRRKLSCGGKCITKSVSCIIKSNLNFRDWKNKFFILKAIFQSVATISTAWNSVHALEPAFAGPDQKSDIILSRKFQAKKGTLSLNLDTETPW